MTQVTTKQKKDTRELKVQTISETVYFDTGREGEVGEVGLKDANCYSILEGVDKLFIYGTAENASFIAGLFERRLDIPMPGLVYIGSPGVNIKKHLPRKELVSKVFSQMNGIDYGSSGSGWHLLRESDYITYALVHEVNKLTEQGPLSERAEWLVRRHPAYPVFAFIKTGNEAAFARLLSLIIDPRWFYDNSDSRIVPKLKEFLGCSGTDCRKRVERILTGRGSVAISYQSPYKRLLLLLQSWLASGGFRVALTNVTEEQLKDPRLYLYRLALTANPEDLAVGVLRAAHVFLAWVTAVWLDNITPHRNLFVPQYFFHDPKMTEPWNEFVAAMEK